MKLPEDPGHGGRNQHLALSAAAVLTGKSGMFLLSGASDGSDGNDDAGALGVVGAMKNLKKVTGPGDTLYVFGL